MMKMMKNMCLAAMAIFAVTTEIAGVIDSNYDETRSMQLRMPVHGLTMWSIGFGEVEAASLFGRGNKVHPSPDPERAAAFDDDVDDDDDEMKLDYGKNTDSHSNLKPKKFNMGFVPWAWTSYKGAVLAWTLVIVLVIIVILQWVSTGSRLWEQHETGWKSGYVEGFDKYDYYGYDSEHHSPFANDYDSTINVSLVDDMYHSGGYEQNHAF